MTQQLTSYAEKDSTPKNSARGKRIYFSVHLQRSLLKKAERHCEYLNPDGQCCDSTYQLKKDHQIPLALGGSNKPENLRILCRTHNNLDA